MRKNYNKTLFLFRNRRVTRHIARLDPVRDHVEIVRLLGCYEFPYDTVRALEMALFRTYASPKISALLDRTGEFQQHGQQRYDDTAILITEFLVDGYDGPVGRRAIGQMNRMHGAYKIDNEEFIFVLSTFVFNPIDWMAQYAWRPMTAGEQEALFQFWYQVGLRMGLSDLPPTLPALKTWAEQYQNDRFRFTESNRRVADATVRIVEGWFPYGLKWAVFPVINALIEPDLRRAFRYPQPAGWLVAFSRGALWIRKQFLKIVTFEATPRTTQSTRYRSYPRGTPEIEKTGPPKLLEAVQRRAEKA